MSCDIVFLVRVRNLQTKVSNMRKKSDIDKFAKLTVGLFVGVL